jgi:hypothetical protein
MTAPRRFLLLGPRTALALVVLLLLVAALCALTAYRRRGGPAGRQDTAGRSAGVPREMAAGAPVAGAPGAADSQVRDRRAQRERAFAAHRRERGARGQRTPAQMRALQERMQTLAASAAAPNTEGRAFLRHPSPEQQELLDAAESRFRNAADDDARMALLDELEDIPHARVLAVAELALASEDADIRRRALEIIGGYEVPAVIPLARRGLADAEAAVRVAAVNALAAVSDAGVVPLLKDAMRDPDEDVRAAVFGILEAKPADVRLDLYQAGILSAYEDVSEAVISAITFAPSQDALYVLFDGLGSPSEDIRRSVNAALYFLISEQFPNRAAAVRWWEANRQRFDAELMEKN